MDHCGEIIVCDTVLCCCDLETLRPSVAPSLRSGCYSSGLRVSKLHRSLGLGIKPISIDGVHSPSSWFGAWIGCGCMVSRTFLL